MQAQTKTRLIFLGLLLLLIILVTSFLMTRPAILPDHIIKLNGRIEADHYLASSKVMGKVFQIKVKEGETVKKGQLLAELEDDQVRAKVTQAAAAFGASLAEYKAAQTDLEVLEKQIPLKIATAQASVKHAKAILNSAQVSREQALKDYLRFKRLYHKGTVDKHQFENSKLSAEVAKDQVLVAETGVTQAQKLLHEAKLGNDQVRAKKSSVAAVKAHTLQAQAAVMEAMSLFEDMKITAPASGVITTKLVNVGEVVAPGSILFDIVNLDQLYLKGYVAENRIGQIYLGQKASIKIDGLPNVDFPATVRTISSQAEFTPKDVQTQDERVKLVYAAKLYLDHNPKHRVTRYSGRCFC